MTDNKDYLPTEDTHRMTNNDHGSITTVNCDDAEPYCIITNGLLDNAGVLRVRCVRCDAEILLLIGIQKFDAIEAARNALQVR